MLLQKKSIFSNITSSVRNTTCCINSGRDYFEGISKYQEQSKHIFLYHLSLETFEYALIVTHFQAIVLFVIFIT